MKTNSLVTKYQMTFKLIYELHPPVILYALLFSLTSSILPYIDLWLLSFVINRLTQPADYQAVMPIILLFLGGIAFLSILTSWFKKKRDDSQTQLILNLDRSITKKLLTIDYAELANPKMRENYQKAKEGTNYNGGLATFITGTMNSLFNLMISLILSGGVMVTLIFSQTTTAEPLLSFINSNWLILVMIMLLTGPIFLGYRLVTQSSRISFKMFDEITYINRLFGYFIDTVADYRNGKNFRLYQSNTLFMEKIIQSNTQTTDFFKKLFLMQYRFEGGSQLVVGIATAFFYLIVALKAYSGAIPIGSTLLYAGLLQQLLLALAMFFNLLGHSNTIVDYIQYYYQFLNQESVYKHGTLPIEKRHDNEYQIEFHDVSFKYPRTDQWILKNLSLRLTIGERMALVGRNGSGKTTFIKLLCRLYEPTSGRITLNGIDIRKYDEAEYQQILGVVFQDFKLFSFSVAENISTSKNPDFDRVDQSLKVAGIEDLISGMPKGVGTTLTKHLDDEGIEVSGGEALKPYFFQKF